MWCPAAGGLGIRILSNHANAVFSASIVSILLLHKAIYLGVSEEHPVLSSTSRCLECITATALGSPLCPTLVWIKGAGNAPLEAALVDPSTLSHMKAHLQLAALLGADSWLHAPPNREQGTQMSSELYRIALRRRMRLPRLDSPESCPMCGAVLDVFLDHALLCSCGGDRT